MNTIFLGYDPDKVKKDAEEKGGEEPITCGPNQNVTDDKVHLTLYNLSDPRLPLFRGPTASHKSYN